MSGILYKAGNKSGIVLIIVMIIIILMAIVSTTIFSQSMSQSKTARSQVDDIVAQQLAKGLYFKGYTSSAASCFAGYSCSYQPPNSGSMIVNGRSYNISYPGASNVDINY